MEEELKVQFNDLKETIVFLNRMMSKFFEHVKMLTSMISQPLRIEDNRLCVRLEMLDKDIKHLYDQLHYSTEAVKKMEVSQTYGEIKFIGKKLDEIEKKIKQFSENGIKKEVSLSFSCDGYELVKKPICYENNVQIEDPNQDLINLLSTIDLKYQKVIIHRLGLLGEKNKTFKDVSKIFGISDERARQIFLKGLRLLRHPSRKKLVDAIKEKKLLKELRSNS